MTSPARPSEPVASSLGGRTAPEIVAAAEAWLADDPDPVTRAELESLIASGGPELAARFAGRLQFGTAGIRGPMQAGPMGMNQVTVRRAAAGVISYVLDAGGDTIVIGCDARHLSDVFAMDTARLASGAGLRAIVLPFRVPTPVLAFATRYFGAAAGVMVTASHNPPADNGYKVYLGDASQIIPPTDSDIARRIDAVANVRDLPMNDERIVHAGPEVLDAFIAAVVALPYTDAREARVVYTPMHGVGRESLLAAFAAAGFPTPVVVREQGDPDPDFPTVAFPNPEEPGAMDLLLALARSTDADLAIANDPDADRLGAAIPSVSASGQPGWRPLTGNEIGWLLADHILAHTSGPRLVATTIVSSTLLRSMAAAAGVAYAETFTGFKWIADAVRHHDETFVFGYEQALGYLVGTHVLDKCGISAALMLAEVAALARRDGVTLQQRLDAIAARFGRHLTAERSLRMEPAEQAVFMAAVRANPPTSLGGQAVTKLTDRRDGNVLVFELGTAQILVRPSGTEPKVKLYGEAVDADPSPLLDAFIAAFPDHHNPN